jgi:hypothetical protein
MITQFSLFVSLITAEILENEYSLYSVHYLSIFLLNLVSYIILLYKFYRVLCYSKLTFEWLAND